MQSKVVAESKPDKDQSFNWLRLLLLMVVFPLFVVLGFWQLDRAEQKEARLASYAQQPRQLVDASEAQRLLGSQLLQPISTRLSFISDHYLLLDNRTRQGRAGYEVFAPVLIGQSLILANLGWVIADPDRTILPHLDLDGITLDEVSGVISQTENLLQLSSAQEAASVWPMRVQAIDLEALGVSLNMQLAPVILRIYTPVLEEITPHLPTINSMPPERHVGYAVQWFGLAAALIIWLVFSVIHSRRNA